MDAGPSVREKKVSSVTEALARNVVESGQRAAARSDTSAGTDRRAARLFDQRLRRHGRPRCHPPDPGRDGRRPRRALELQGWKVWIVFGGDKRHAAADVHDEIERAGSAEAGYGGTHACLPA